MASLDGLIRVASHSTRPIVAALAALALGSLVGLVTVEPVSSAANATLPNPTIAPPGPSEVSDLPAPTLPPTTTIPSKAKPTAARPASTATTLFPVEQIRLLSEGLDYELTVTPSCVTFGQTITAAIRLKPNGSSAVFMPFYADGSFEKGKGDVTKENPVITYTWPVRPIAGEGRLLTQAHDAETNEKGTKIVAFRIVEPGKSC